MCDDILTHAPKPSRRVFLRALGVSAAAVGVSIASPAAASAMTGQPPVQDRSRKSRTRLALLGTAGGPAYNGGPRAGISTAIVYGEKIYVVDLGLGATQRLAASGLPSTDVFGSALNNLAGVFFTHLHSDRTADWPAMYVTAASNMNGRTGGAVQVFGPGNRGTLPRVYPPSRPAPPLISPDDPTPGIAGLTSYLDRAYAQDLNDRIRDSNFTPPSQLFQLNDIDLTGIWDVDAEGTPPRLASPIPVWQDGDVTVTATLVDHHPTAPAFAYRFDTPDGSIVVSGDTAVSENLIDLAKDADYLVHEVIDPEWVDTIAMTLPPAQQEPLRQHLLGSHTSVQDVGPKVAERAGVKNLVLSHLVPASSPERVWRTARRGYSGKLIVGQDLTVFPVGNRR